jgi:ABC-type sugar transport system substrate-binding protein
LYVIALDTPPDPTDIVDITFATNNFNAGELVGQWTAGTMKGKDVTVAMLDLFSDKVVSVDVARDTGFLKGMGISVPDAAKNGSEPATGTYSGGKYTVACHEPTEGAEDGGRTAMETCLSKTPDVNVVYTINEPAAAGAYAALKAAGKEKDVTIVSVDGGCAGVENVKNGVIGATSQQYPGKMAQMGVEAIYKLATTGEKPTTSEGLDYFNTGVALVTDNPVSGVDSITAAEGAKKCWG